MHCSQKTEFLDHVFIDDLCFFMLQLSGEILSIY